MDIKDLNAFLKERAPSAIKEVLLSNFNGKKCAIDASIFMYKFLYKNPRFLEGFFQQISRLRSNGITPIYIFDGIPDKAKFETIQNRKEKKIDYKNRIESIESKLSDKSCVEDKKQLSIDLAKLKKKLIHVTKEHIESLKYLLDIMNIKWIHPECEADVICGKLLQNGVVDIVMSDDMDLLVSGSDILLRDFHISTNKIVEYRVEKILSDLELTKDQWIDFCILCGCDYVCRIPGVGPKNAFKLIKLYGSIDKIIENLCGENKKYKLPNNYDYERARDLFKNCDKYKDEYNDIIVNVDELFDNQLDNIRNYVAKNSNLSIKQIDNRFKKIYKLI